MQFFLIALVFNENNEILGVKKEIPKGFLELCEINYDPGPIWFAPSGDQLKGETREQAAERIVLYETGYKVKAMYQVQNTLAFHLIKQSGGFFKTVIVCYLDNKNQQNNFERPEHIKDIKWFTKEELIKNTLAEIVEKWPETLKNVILKA
ncbi:MAG: hypothetical protein KatS3mg095_0649 [Candidatus Parcubacteria bacterium]|nr:MAG: hypothetical protein KatS3mg095_0649 [Candidatus Parcubacteria bacterium]